MKTLNVKITTIATLLIIFTGMGCKPKSMSLSGKIIIPQGQRMAGVQVGAMMNGAEVASAPVDPTTGNYTIPLAQPGVYDLRLKTPKGVLDFAGGVKVGKGEQAHADDFPAPVDLFEETPPAPEIHEHPTSVVTKPPVTEESHAGPLATVRGEVHPAEADVKIMSEGKVIARGKAVGGEFVIPSVPAGLYDIEYSAPGYAASYHENIPVSAEGALQNLKAYLLFESPIDGVDWEKGTMTATGLGKPNPSMSGPQAALMSCRAARVVAFRDLLNIILQVQVDPGKSIATLDTTGNFKSVLEGFVQGARVVSENAREDGSCEVTLEIPINGKSSVTSFIQQMLDKK